MPVVDDVMQHDAAIRMHGGIHLRHGAKRGDHDRHLVLHAHHQIVFQPPVRRMDDLVDGKWCRWLVGIGGIIRCKFFRYLCQPFVELAFGPRIERRKSPDDTRLALRQRQLRMRYDEERRCHDRQPQPVLEDRWKHKRNLPNYLYVRWCIR
ncbi:hypothetical protein D3C87_1610650 [compost metagenome]